MPVLQPRLRFREFANAWTKRKLGKLYVERNERGNDALPILSVSIHAGVSKGELDSDSLGKEVRRSEDKSLYKRVYPGDLVFNMMRAWQGAIGCTEVAGMVSPAYITAAPGDVVHPPFMDRALRRTPMVAQIDSQSYGVTDFRKRLYWDSFAAIDCALPSVPEQTKIAELMSHLDALIAANQRKTNLLQQLKRAYLQELFPAPRRAVPRLRFPGFTDAWEQRKLGDMGTTFTGLSGKTKDDFGHGDAEFITYMNVFSNTMAVTEPGTESVEIDSRQSEVRYGDVLFTTSSETPEEVGMSSVWLGTRPNVYLNSFCFGWRPTVCVDKSYLGYVLRSPDVRCQLVLLAQGISRYNISKNKAMEVLVPIPCAEEQSRVGEFLATLDHLITLHQRKCDLLDELKRGYLQKMFV